MNRGIAYALGAYLIWGILPVYWKIIQNVPALEIIAHRIVWAFIFVLLIIFLKRYWSERPERFVPGKEQLLFLFTGVLLFINWFVYIWAVNAGLIVDASLGYFINPLVNVVLGVIFFRERLDRRQWIPVGIATVGVLYLTVSYGALPWIGLILALSFGFYGLLKKSASIGSLEGFSLETGFLFLPALVYLISLEYAGEGTFPHGPTIESLLLIFTGVVTGLPLLLFGAAARMIPLSTLGFIQYIAPTLQFLIGVIVYNEKFSINRLIGFGFIWLALLLYSINRIKIKN